MHRSSFRPPSRAPFKPVVVLVALGLISLGAAACGAQSSPTNVPLLVSPTAARIPAPLPVSLTPSRAPAPSSSIDRYVRLAKQVYDTEAGGAPARRELGHVADDPHVVALLRSGAFAQARRYVQARFRSQWFPNEHMSRLRILRARQAPLDLGVRWVVWPMLQRTLGSGQHRTRIQVAVQDVIGFVRAMHNKHPAVQIVVRDATGRHAVSLLGPAAHASLPMRGFVTIRGVRYQVRTFARRSFLQAPAPVTVWVLLPVKAR